MTHQKLSMREWRWCALMIYGIAAGTSASLAKNLPALDGLDKTNSITVEPLQPLPSATQQPPRPARNIPAISVAFRLTMPRKDKPDNAPAAHAQPQIPPQTAVPAAPPTNPPVKVAEQEIRVSPAVPETPAQSQQDSSAGRPAKAIPKSEPVTDIAPHLIDTIITVAPLQPLPSTAQKPLQSAAPAPPGTSARPIRSTPVATSVVFRLTMPRLDKPVGAPAMKIQPQPLPQIPVPPASPTNQPVKAGGQDVRLSSDAPTLLREAQQDLQAGRTTEAIPKLEQVVNTAPHLIDVWEKLGRAYWALGRQDDTLALWLRLRAREPKELRVYNWLGAACYECKDMPHAAEYYEQSLQLKPNQFEVELALARITAVQGNLNGAIERLQILLTKDPKNEEVNAEVARVLGEKRYETAMPLTAATENLSPTNPVAVSKQLDVLMQSSVAATSPQQIGVVVGSSSATNVTGRMIPDGGNNRFAIPADLETAPQGSYHINPFKPYVGIRGDYFSDNLDSRDWWLFGLGGLNLASNLTVAGRAGLGHMRQPFTNSIATSIPDVALDEKTAGLSFALTLPNTWELRGEISDRMLTGDAPTNLNGGAQSYSKSVVHYSVEGQAKPSLPLDLTLHWEHDAAPEARAVVNGITYNLGTLMATYDLFDWWSLAGSAERYWISDGNNRDHVNLNSSWLVWEPVGLRLGLGYAYANSDEASQDYWTPYQLSRYYAEAAMLGNWMRADYNLRLRYGVGQQGVRPGETQGAQQPESGWQPVIGIRGTMRIQLDNHWEIKGELYFNKVPAYNETSVTAGINYKF